jgi:hypothetical protein
MKQLTKNTSSKPLLVSFGKVEQETAVTEMKTAPSFIYDPIRQITIYMGGSQTTMCKRSVRHFDWDQPRTVNDDEC